MKTEHGIVIGIVLLAAAYLSGVVTVTTEQSSLYATFNQDSTPAGSTYNPGNQWLSWFGLPSITPPANS